MDWTLPVTYIDYLEYPILHISGNCDLRRLNLDVQNTLLCPAVDVDSCGGIVTEIRST